MPATLHDVARLAGVSVKTVSNVVNDYPHIRPATKAKVLAAIEQLGYQPNLSARSLRSGRSGVIGLALPELSLPYFAELAADVIAAANRRDLLVLIEQTNRLRAAEEAVLSSPRRRMLDGLLFSPVVLGMADAGLVSGAAPLVLLGEHLFTPAVDHVTMRNVDAARAATDHLIGLGRRRIAALGVHPGEVVGSAGLRLRGYREAMSAAGLPVDERLLLPAGLWFRRQGAEAMRRLLASGVDVDAVFAFNDTLALGAMYVLQEAGRRVPDDVAVMGFDDSDEGRYSLPTLSTVDAGRRAIAETAVATLVRRLDDPHTPARLQEIGFTLVARESTQQAFATL